MAAETQDVKPVIFVRYATPEDVPVIHQLIRMLLVFVSFLSFRLKAVKKELRRVKKQKKGSKRSYIALVAAEQKSFSLDRFLCSLSLVLLSIPHMSDFRRLSRV